MDYQSGAVRPVGSIEEGWNLIKNDYWTFFLMTLVAIIILFAASIILGLINNGITFAILAAFGGSMRSTGDIERASAAIVPQLISIIISFFTNILVVAISGVMFCGIYSALSRKASGGNADFSDLFRFEKFQPCLIVGLVVSFVQLVIGVVTLLIGAAVGVSAIGSNMITKNGQLNPAVFGGFFLVIIMFAGVSIILNLIISALTSFVYPLLAERDLSGGQALLLSAKAGLANLGRLILLLILMGLMTLGGVIVCFVGVLFVAPVLTASLFAAYQSVFGRASGEYFYQAPPPPPVFNNQTGF